MNSALSVVLLPAHAAPSGTPKSVMATANRPASRSTMGTGASPDPTLWSAVAQYYGLPTALLEALTTVESSNDQRVVSSAGAIGYTQLMPKTAAALGVSPNQPIQNLEGGAAYLAQQLHTFHGNLVDAVAAYNAGPGAVTQYAGIPPYAQTQNYVRKVLASYDQYSQTST